MPDRGKVVRGLECCQPPYDCHNCPYDWDDCFIKNQLHKDALALLKEQQHQIWEMQDRTEYFEDKLKSQPQIVRCKDCIHGKQLLADYISCQISEENESGCHVSHEPDWFCADGERKEGR